MPLHIFSPQSVILPNISVAFALLATASGLTALLSPADGIQYFGLRPIHESAARELSEALAQVYGIRNASMGLSSIIIWFLHRQSNGIAKLALRRALGAIFLAQAGIPLVDGLVSARQGKTSPWTHWTFVPITVVLGAAMLVTPDA